MHRKVGVGEFGRSGGAASAPGCATEVGESGEAEEKLVGESPPVAGGGGPLLGTNSSSPAGAKSEPAGSVLLATSAPTHGTVGCGVESAPPVAVGSNGGGICAPPPPVAVGSNGGASGRAALVDICPGAPITTTSSVEEMVSVWRLEVTVCEAGMA